MKPLQLSHKVETGCLRHPGAEWYSWQPALRWNCSHGWQILATQPQAPTQNREETGSIQADNTVEREGGTEKGEQPLRRIPTRRKMPTIKEMMTTEMQKLLQCPLVHGPKTHGVLACDYIMYKIPLTAKVRLVLLVLKSTWLVHSPSRRHNFSLIIKCDNM